MQLETWIAARLDSTDALTWRVTLRPDVTFHDGSVVDAAAVKTSLETSMAAQPGTTSIIPAGTQFTASGLTLDIRTPVPVGSMASSLAAFNVAIRKTAADGSVLSTGPFVPTEFVERQSLTLSAYAGYRDWGPQDRAHPGPLNPGGEHPRAGPPGWRGGHCPRAAAIGHDEAAGWRAASSASSRTVDVRRGR